MNFCLDANAQICVFAKNEDMEGLLDKKQRIEELRRMIVAAEGFAVPSDRNNPLSDLGLMDKSFPTGIFPIGAIHEFISSDAAAAASSSGFISCLMGMLMKQKGLCVWVSIGNKLYPPSLKGFGIDPDRVIFIQVSREKDALWAIEEALKCPSLAGVVGEIRDMDLTASRRLQLAVEQSQVTGFLHRYRPRRIENVACVSRWYIRPLPSSADTGLPGIGRPIWQVELQKIRNGKPGTWQICWVAGQFHYLDAQVVTKGDVYTQTGTW